MTIRIVTDSACDLPDALAQELGIDIVPLTIRFGDLGLELGHSLTSVQSDLGRFASREGFAHW